MPLTFNISHGLAAGIMVYALVKLAARPRPRGALADVRAGGAVRAAVRVSAGVSAFPLSR